MKVTLAPARPPCSTSERDAAEYFVGDLARVGLSPVMQNSRAPTSPTWAPLIRALLRVWAAAFLAAGSTFPCTVLAALSLAGAVPYLTGLIRYLPVLGGTTVNVFAGIAGTNPRLRPIVVAAHLDTHPTDGAPLVRWHRLVANASAAAIFYAAIWTSAASVWRSMAGPVAAEAIFTIAWLARNELIRDTSLPDDNTSGLWTLTRLADLATTTPPVHDLYLLATGAGTSGGWGMRAFFATHLQMRRSWVIDVDALGSGEVIASPVPARFPLPGTPSALARAVEGAARAIADPLSVRRVRRPHSDARAALRYRVGAITITGGVPHPHAAVGPDNGNAARAARLAYELARAAQ